MGSVSQLSRLSRQSQQPQLSRRKILLAAIGGGVGLVLGGRAFRPAPATQVVRTSRALGAEVTIRTAGLDEPRAVRAIEAAFAALDEVEQAMSLYRPSSAICRLNATRRCDSAPASLLEVLAFAAETSSATRGAFDITVQPLWEVAAKAQRENRTPSAEEIASACERVDWKAVVVNGSSVELRAPTSAITLNGIAQGFAADRALDALRAHGVEHALVDTGELRGLGRKPDGRPWSIGIQHPRESDAYVALAALEGRALATSGDYATKFSDDSLRHHIFDPRTGRSPLELASVTIAAPTAIEADALSTAAMVLGHDATLDLVRSRPGVDALLVRKDGRVSRTAGFPELQEQPTEAVS